MTDLRSTVFDISRIDGIIHDDSIHNDLGYYRRNLDSHSLCYKISGYVRFWFNNDSNYLDFKPGMLCLFPRGIDYRIERIEVGEAVRIEFQTNNEEVQNIPPFSELFRTHAAFGALYQKLEACYKASLWNFDYRTMAVIYEIFALLDSSVRYSAVSSAAERRARDAVSYLEAHYMNPSLSIEETAAHASTSVASLRRYFTVLYGIPPVQYLMRLRINAAQSLLIGGDRSIEEISLLSGFSDPFYFSRCFKVQCGETPRDFRRSKKNRCKDTKD